MMEITVKKKIAAGLSITSNSVIIILKLAAGILTGSMSIISEALHSLSDCLASIMTFFAVLKSSKPADKNHPFGHERYEDMSGFIEGGLIIFAALFIIFEAVKKLISGVNYEFDTHPGIIVMSFSVIVNIFVSRFIFKIANESNSISLRADAEHLRTDVYSSAGVLLGLVLIKITGFAILDPIIAIFAAIFILKTGLSVSKETFNNLLDCSLPADEITVIEKIIESYKNSGILNYTGLKSRKTGAVKNVEFTIICPKNMTIFDCHNLCDKIEAEIEQKLGNTCVLIHAEPECCKNLPNHQV